MSVRRASGPVGIDRGVPMSKTGGMAGRERWGLRGNVHVCRLERTCFIHRCGKDACETQQWGDSSMLEFREDANFAWHSHHNSDGSEWISTYEYDDAGKLLTVRSASGGALLGLTLYEDDAAGRLVRVLYRPQTGGPGPEH